MKETLLKFSFFSLGTICCAIFIMIRVADSHKLIMSKKFKQYGELYNFSMVDNFKEVLPENLDTPNSNGEYMKYRNSTKHPEINEADILTFGDSFFYYPRHTSFPERLADSLNKKVFYENYYNPLAVLNTKKYIKGERKAVIYEIGERGISTRFSVKMNPKEIAPAPTKSKPIVQVLSSTQAEIRYNRILQKSIFSNYIYSSIATLKYNVFGYMSSLTPVYNEDTKFLFFFDTINGKRTSYQYKYTEIEIEKICSNIEYLKNQLSEKYNLELVFIPIPSKITIYDYMVGWNDYNDLLPNLYRALDSRNIKNVNLYKPFKASNEILYYPTDTHWNKNGVDLALNTTIQYLDSVGVIQHNYLE